MSKTQQQIEMFVKGYPGNEVPVEEILRQNNMAEDERRVVVDILKRMPDGEFITGRRGHPSRFRKGKGYRAEEARVTSVSPMGNTLFEHQYLLRSEVIAKFLLPIDLNQDEAERLSAFLKTLPISRGE